MLVVVPIKLECRYATTDDEEENVSHDVTPFGPKTLEHKTKKPRLNVYHKTRIKHAKRT